MLSVSLQNRTRAITHLMPHRAQRQCQTGAIEIHCVIVQADLRHSTEHDRTCTPHTHLLHCACDVVQCLTTPHLGRLTLLNNARLSTTRGGSVRYGCCLGEACARVVAQKEQRLQHGIRFFDL
jgi:hypothetical protein